MNMLILGFVKQCIISLQKKPHMVTYGFLFILRMCKTIFYLRFKVKYFRKSKRTERGQI